MLKANLSISIENHADRVFITGIYGSGKTHLAKGYSVEQDLEYISFDRLFDYSSRANQSKGILPIYLHRL